MSYRKSTRIVVSTVNVVLESPGARHPFCHVCGAEVEQRPLSYARASLHIDMQDARDPSIYISAGRARDTKHSGSSYDAGHIDDRSACQSRCAHSAVCSLRSCSVRKRAPGVSPQPAPARSAAADPPPPWRPVVSRSPDSELCCPAGSVGTVNSRHEQAQ